MLWDYSWLVGAPSSSNRATSGLLCNLSSPASLLNLLHSWGCTQLLNDTNLLLKIDAPPSTLAYVDLTSPAYGTIKTDRLLVHFRANSVALQQGPNSQHHSNRRFNTCSTGLGYGYIRSEAYRMNSILTLKEVRCCRRFNPPSPMWILRVMILLSPARSSTAWAQCSESRTTREDWQTLVLAWINV